MDVRKGSRRGGVGRHVGVENEYGDGDAATVRACPPTLTNLLQHAKQLPTTLHTVRT